ncbi:MAG: hypothetical protein GEU71_06890 [Actinobacteria bacterium]|nr:hypothetical protein [Actinomycetota bacterium]
MDVAVTRRHARGSWVNVRTALGLILFCAALIAGQRMLEGAQTTVPVWSTVRDLPQDHVLGPGDIELVEAKLPASVLTRYVPAEQAIVGSILTRAVGVGELIAADWVSAADSGASRSMTIPVAPEHAVGGDLRPGDRIDVYATFDPGDIRAKTSLLLRGAEVLQVVTAGGLTLGDEALVGVTVGISPEDSARVAFAVRTAEIDIVRVVGAVGTVGTETVRAEDFE